MKIGEAYIDIKINDGQLDAQLRNTESKAKKAAQNIQNAFGQTSKSEAAIRRLAIMQINAAEEYERKIRKIANLQMSAASDYENKIRKMGLVQAQALSENESRTRKMAQLQITANKEYETGLRRIGILHSQALSENEKRNARSIAQQRQGEELRAKAFMNERQWQMHINDLHGKALIQNEKINKEREKAALLAESTGNKISSSAGKEAGGLSQLEKTLSRVQRTMIALASVVAARWVKDLFEAPIRAGIEFNQTLEDSRIGIASLLNATQNYTSILTGASLQGQEAWNASMEQSKQIQIELQAANLRTAATYDQILRAFQEALPYGASAKFDTGQVLKFTEAVVKAASAMRIPLDMLNEEMRSILSGTMNPRNTRLYPLMIAAGLTNDKIKELRKEGKLFDALMTAMAGTTRGADEALNTFTVRLSNLKDAFQQLSGQAFQGTFDALKQSFKDLTDMMVKISEKGGKTTFEYNQRIISSFGMLDSIVSTLIKSITGLGMAIDDFRKNHPVLMQFTETFASIAIQVGVTIVALNLLGKSFALLFAAGRWLLTGGFLTPLIKLGATTTGIAATILGPAGLTFAFGALLTAFVKLASEIEVNGLKVREWTTLAGTYIDQFINYLTFGMYYAWKEVASNYPEAIAAFNTFMQTLKTLAQVTVDAIKAMFKDMLGGIYNAIQAIREAKASYLESGYQAATELAGGTGSTIGKKFIKKPMGDLAAEEKQRMSTQLLQDSLHTARNRILSGEAAEERERRKQLSGYYTGREGIWENAFTSSGKNKNTDIDKKVGGKGGGPLDYEDINQYIDQFEKKMARLIQSLNNLFSDYYIQMLEDSGRFYEAEDERTKQRIEEQKYAYEQMLDSANDYVRELEEKVAKRGSKDPKLDEALLKAQKQRDELLSKESENISKITTEEERLNKVRKERIELQDKENIAELNSQYQVLIGTLQQRAKAENEVLRAKLAIKEQGISDESNPLKKQILYMETLIALEQIRRNEIQATGSILDGFSEAFRQWNQNAPTMADIGTTLFNGMKDSIEGAATSLINFTTSGATAFEDFGRSVINTLKQIAVQMMVTGIMNIIGKAAGSYFGGGGGGEGANYASMSSGFTATLGGRASGGPVSALTPYIVGERGPELFVPKTSGYIHPNGTNLGSNIQTTITVNAQLPASTGDPSKDKENSRTMGREIARAVRDEFMKNLAREQRAGGALNRGVQI